MINDNIVVVRKDEFAILTEDSMLARLTRKLLRDETGDYIDARKLRFIYDVPAAKGKEGQ